MRQPPQWPALRVSGGVGGGTARLDDVDRAAGQLVRLAAELAGRARPVAELAIDPRLVVTAAISPLTWAQAERAVLAATVGPGGLLALAAGVDLLGVRLAAVAHAYRQADALAAGSLRALGFVTGYVVGSELGRVAAPVVLAAGLSVAVVAGLRRCGVRVRPAGEWPPGRWNPESWAAAAGVTELGRQRVGSSLVWLFRRVDGGLGDHLVAVLPGLVTGLLSSAPPLASWTAVACSQRAASPDGPSRYWPLVTMPQVAALGDIVAGPTPWLRESTGERALLGTPRAVGAPIGVADLVSRIPTSAGPPAGSSVVRIQQITGADGRRAWIVSIPGTAAWSARPAQTPFDLTGDVHLLAGEPTAATVGVRDAMTRAGIGPGEPVLLAGYSQGGMVAAALAADADFRRRFAVTHVITAGSPIAWAHVPASVAVLSLEHSDDLVPHLDGDANPDRPSWLTVTRPAGGDLAASGLASDDVPLATHQLAVYRRTGAAVDGSSDPSVQVWRRGLAPFLDRPGARSVVQDAVLTRVRPGAAP